jgi:predicted nucleotidyltransferase
VAVVRGLAPLLGQARSGVNPDAELDRLTGDLRRILGQSLVGIYAHGSYALGCFNPSLSDLDVLVVTANALMPAQRRALEQALADRSHLEIHFLSRSGLVPSRHPAPYDLHFGSERVVGPGVDHDLAAHFTVARRAGVALAGPPPVEIFPEVPWADYEDSLRRDLASCGEDGGGIYAVLSPARIWATLTERVVHSKASGAAWSLERAAQRFRPLIANALEIYLAGTTQPRWERQEVRPWAEFVVQALERVDDPPPEAGFARREAPKRRET